MKILKNLLIGIGVLLLIFMALGFIWPSISYTSEIEVNKPIEESWAVMNDESKLSQWLKGITKIEHISGEKGTIGAKMRYTFSENGQESQIVETMKAIRPNEHVAMDFEMEGVMKMDYQVDFSEKDGKTLIKSSTNNKGESMIMRSMMCFMQGTFQEQEDENMANLKALIESNTTDYFPESSENEVELEVMEE